MSEIYFPEAKWYRKKTGLTVEKLSKLSSVPVKTITLLESGEGIEENAFIKIAEGLNKILKEKNESLIDIDLMVNGIGVKEDNYLFF